MDDANKLGEDEEHVGKSSHVSAAIAALMDDANKLDEDEECVEKKVSCFCSHCSHDGRSKQAWRGQDICVTCELDVSQSESWRGGRPQ